MSRPRCLLDASAVLALLRDEKGAATIERLLPVAAISAVNMTEMVVTIAGLHSASRCVEDLTAAGLSILDYRLTVDDVTAVRGADPDRTLSLGGTCCLAAGRSLGLPVITDDTAWPPVATAVGVTTHLFR